MEEQNNLSSYLKNCKKYKKYNYKELPLEELSYLHETNLKILKEIQKVLKNHSINYCVVGGTLLGAVTRQSYIPWDEDIDLAVFEEDFEKVIQLLMKELPQWIVVQCSYTEPKYYHEWIKVSDKNSIVYPNNKSYRYKGVWVDIYKLRKMKRKNVEKRIAEDHREYLLRRLKVKDINYEEYRKRMKENDVVKRIIRGAVRSFFIKDNKYVYLIGTASKPYVEEDFVFPLKEYLFEDTVVSSFNNAEGYLKNHYGEDFREVPAEEHRTIAINHVEIIVGQDEIQKKEKD